jgi:hypothetical protein
MAGPDLVAEADQQDSNCVVDGDVGNEGTSIKIP